MTIVSAGCVQRAPFFRCSDQGSCEDPGAVCEANGFCSFHDTACPSGQRYGTYAGDGLSGLCTSAPSANSCESLAATCGPTGSSPCCESSVVTGGTYARSYDVSGDGSYPDSSYQASVSSFRLDKYTVTVGRFRKFVSARMGT